MKFVFDRESIVTAASKCGSTLEQLAKLCNVHTSTMARALSGGTLNLRSYSRISQALNIDGMTGKKNASTDVFIDKIKNCL